MKRFEKGMRIYWHPTLYNSQDFASDVKEEFFKLRDERGIKDV